MGSVGSGRQVGRGMKGVCSCSCCSVHVTCSLKAESFRAVLRLDIYCEHQHFLTGFPWFLSVWIDLLAGRGVACVWADLSWRPVMAPALREGAGMRARLQGLGVQPVSRGLVVVPGRPNCGAETPPLESRVRASETSSHTCGLPDPAGVRRSAIDRASSAASSPQRPALPASATIHRPSARPAPSAARCGRKGQLPGPRLLQSSRSADPCYLQPSQSGPGSFLRPQGSVGWASSFIFAVQVIKVIILIINCKLHPYFQVNK